METWRKINGYNNQYSVSNFGNVRKDNTNRILKIKMLPDDYEYQYVTLKEGHKYKEVLIYKLIVNAFVTNKQVFNNIYYNEQDDEWSTNLITEEDIVIELGIVESEEDAHYQIGLFHDIVNNSFGFFQDFLDAL
jgi:hypothetical protein